MTSIGQGVIGTKSHIGASAPTRIIPKNISDIVLNNPSFVFAVEHQWDQREHCWLEVKLTNQLHEPIHEGTFHQQTMPSIFTPARGIITNEDPDAEIVLTTDLQLEANKLHYLMVRASTDPHGEVDPSERRWWTPWLAFPFTPMHIGPWDYGVQDFRLWERMVVTGGRRDKFIEVPQDGQCHNCTPFAEWSFDHPYDYFMWAITQNKAQSWLTTKTNSKYLDFSTFPCFDGEWYLKIMPVWNGIPGQLYTHHFTIVGTEITID